MRILFPAAVLVVLAGCGEAIKDDHFAKDVRQDQAAAPAVRTEAVPVRIGELGSSFAACNARGTTRNLAAGATLPVRSAPFDSAAETDRIAAAGRFFICTRSHDQRWMGVVYEDPGAPAADCGVSSPVAGRQGYDGPCRSGWVASAFVKLVAS